MSMDERAPSPVSLEQENSAAAGNGERRRKRILIGIATLAAIALGVLAYWFFFLRGIVFTDDARFSGHLVDIAPEINGRLVEVAVHEGQFVHKGDLIFRLDPEIPQAALDRAEANLVSARASAASSAAILRLTVAWSSLSRLAAATNCPARATARKTLTLSQSIARH